MGDPDPDARDAAIAAGEPVIFHRISDPRTALAAVRRAVEPGSPTEARIMDGDLPVYRIDPPGVALSAEVVGRELWIEVIEGTEAAVAVCGLAARFHGKVDQVRLWSFHRPTTVERWMAVNLPEARPVYTEYVMEADQNGRQQ